MPKEGNSALGYVWEYGSCSPCLERTCRFGHYNCLRDIAAEEAAGALEAYEIFA